jgi:hypothetical protein
MLVSHIAESIAKVILFFQRNEGFVLRCVKLPLSGSAKKDPRYADRSALEGRSCPRSLGMGAMQPGKTVVLKLVSDGLACDSSENVRGASNADREANSGAAGVNL